jgi:hypothetical protein
VRDRGRHVYDAGADDARARAPGRREGRRRDRAREALERDEELHAGRACRGGSILKARSSQDIALSNVATPLRCKGSWDRLYAVKRRPARQPPKGIEPYYPVARADRDRREISRLIGFDIVQVQWSGWRWLLRHGFLRKDENGNLVGVPEAERPSMGREKAKALNAAIDGVTSAEFMHAPERLAGRRWYAALTSAVAALDAFMPYAHARMTEDSYFAARTTRGGYDDVLNLTTEIGKIAESLSATMQEAKKQIRLYKDDPLPGLEPGRRPHLGYLGRIEANLNVAGFTYEEIAALVRDNNRTEDQRSKVRTARTSHIERIRKRVARFKPAIVLQLKREALTNERMDQFLQRTGQPTIREAFDAWTQSIESKALDRDLRRLDAEAAAGK